MFGGGSKRMMNRYFAVLGLALLSTVVSQAGLTVGYVNATDVSGSTWQFNYQLTLADSDELAPATINGVAQCLSGNGVSAPTTTTWTNSTFATLYDIPNLVN